MKAFLILFGVVVLVISTPSLLDDFFCTFDSPLHIMKVGHSPIKPWQVVVKDIGMILFIYITLIYIVFFGG